MTRGTGLSEVPVGTGVRSPTLGTDGRTGPATRPSLVHSLSLLPRGLRLGVPMSRRGTEETCLVPSPHRVDPSDPG